jgi:hypothetical protein
VNDDKISKELNELYQERESLVAKITPLSHRKDTVDAIISTLERLKNGDKKVRHRFVFNSSKPKLPLFKDAVFEIMKSLGEPFDGHMLEQQLKVRYPDLVFAHGSIRKPIRLAKEAGHIALAKPNEGNRSQAMYIWKGQK